MKYILVLKYNYLKSQYKYNNYSFHKIIDIDNFVKW